MGVVHDEEGIQGPIRSNGLTEAGRFLFFLMFWRHVTSKVKAAVRGCPRHIRQIFLYSLAWRRRRALVITETELKLMAAAAKMGLSRIPKNGYRTPAAMGTPMAL
jgi:hypothetical protein